MTILFAGFALWALAKAFADADMWRAIYGETALISQRVRNWHTLSLLEDIGAAIAGIGAASLWLSAGRVPAALVTGGAWLLANVLFRVVYVRLMYGTWDVTSPYVNRTAAFLWLGRDRALQLGRAGAVVYYGAQIAAGVALTLAGA
jgi:hypothetical protein